MSILDEQETKRYIHDVLREWSIPTASIALVDLQSDISETRHFKLPSIDESIDENTIWSICSNTKLFTVVALGILVEEGKLSWTDKLCDLVPGLHLKDEYASANLTLEDALSHQSGIPAYNDTWYTYSGKQDEIVDIINKLEPNYRPLRKWQYCNGMYNLAGQIVALKSGQKYTDFVTDRILVPLGMNQSSFGGAVEGGKLADPYISVPGSPAQKFGYGFQQVPDDWIGAAAGGLLCSARDVAIWMGYLLRLAVDDMKAGDAKIIKPTTFKEIMRARCLTEDTLLAFPSKSGESVFGETSPATYALALWRCHYRGFDLMYHGGAGIGAGSIVLMLPERQLALAIFTAMASAGYNAIPAIAYKLLDGCLGLPELDWRERVNKRFQDRLALRQTPNRLRSAVTKELYNTVFEHPAFGKLHMLAPGDAAEGKPATVRTAMRNISKARLYGPAFPGEPDILAVFETQQLEVTYTALCRTVDGSYWAQHHLIHKSGDCEDLIDATEMVLYDSTGRQAQCEFGDESMLLRYTFVDKECDFEEPFVFRKVE